jgi:7,8-dihydro-6-hydroxymethylpterin-pyrophosphokinase
MSLAFFSLGSNIEPSKNLSDARIELSKYFSLKKFSSTYQSPSVGISIKDLAEQKKFTNELLKLD